VLGVDNPQDIAKADVIAQINGENTHSEGLLFHLPVILNFFVFFCILPLIFVADYGNVHSTFTYE